MIAQIVNREKVRQLLNEDKVVSYIGFDPTANNLYVGHFVQVMIMAHMQRIDHTPIALFGGGTGMIGDPSEKSDMRRILTKEDINHNIACLQKQMSRLIGLSEGKAIMADSGDWLLNLNYIELMCKVGIRFSANRTLTVECYKQRLERGPSLFELNYIIMQSYDSSEFNGRYDYILQMSESDQWSNTINGVKPIRRTKSKEAYGITFTLPTTSEGKKMGKMEKGAVWLDPGKALPFDFYQYWRNVGDTDVVCCMKLLTFLPLSRITKYEAMTGNELSQAKEALVFEATKLVYGEEEAAKAQEVVRALFSGGRNSDNVPSTELSASDLVDSSMSILEVMIKAGSIPSKGKGRRLVQQGGASVDDRKVTIVGHVLAATDLEEGFVIIKKSKKVFHKVILQE